MKSDAPVVFMPSMNLRSMRNKRQIVLVKKAFYCIAVDCRLEGSENNEVVYSTFLLALRTCIIAMTRVTIAATAKISDI